MRNPMLSVLTIAAFLGCVPRSGEIDRGQLLGAWTSGGPSFDFYVQDSTVLYEFDMQEHRYVLEGDVMVVDFGSVELGVQRKRILSVGKDSLVLQDIQTETRTTFYRMP